MTPSAQTAGGRRVTRWTRELIIEKILEWDARYGEPPCSADWNPSLARWRAQEWRAERYREGVWPSTNAAKRPFGGSFDAAVRAAGLEPHRPGPRRREANAARPAIEQREPRDELTGNVAELERALIVAEGRAERAEAKVSEARRRARRAGDRAERARRARDRVRVGRAPAMERVEQLIADAEARVRAADDQAEAALRDAAEARAETAAAERRARELSALVADGQRRLTGGELTELREGGPSGPAVLAAALRRLARARAAGDRGGQASALAEIASAAVRWRDRI
jgi:flagellar biosynthesis/type III secretory pathway protein FliH